MLPFEELATEEYLVKNKSCMYVKYTQDGPQFYDYNLGIIFVFSPFSKLVPHSSTGTLCKQNMTVGKPYTRKEIVDYIKNLYSIDNLPFNYWIQIPRYCEINLADLPNLSIKQFVNTIQLIFNQDPNYFRYYSRGEHPPTSHAIPQQTIPSKYVQMYPDERLTAYQLKDMLEYAYGAITDEQFRKLPENVYTLTDVLREVKKASNLADIILGLGVINPIILMERKSINPDDVDLDDDDDDDDDDASHYNNYGQPPKQPSEYMTLDQM